MRLALGLAFQLVSTLAPFGRQLLSNGLGQRKRRPQSATGHEPKGNKLKC
jgi:hypothetical protein